MVNDAIWHHRTQPTLVQVSGLLPPLGTKPNADILDPQEPTQWNLKENVIIFIKEKVFENVFCLMVAILQSDPSVLIWLSFTVT